MFSVYSIDSRNRAGEEVMFCDGCGAALSAGQTFCGRCGREVRGGLSLAQPRPNRVREHIRLLGIFWLAYSAVHVVGGIMALVVANTLFDRSQRFFGPEVPSVFLHTALTVVSLLVFVKAAAGFAAGWGLLQRQPWARILTLIVAFVSLFNIPFGTALGIYTLWVLLPTQSDVDYQQESRAA
jgi:hypothetical protein